jgi:GNAT superfamily N-acetyltransferase
VGGVSSLRRASAADLAELVDLMAEFYAEAGYPLNRTLAADAFAALVGDERLGYAWLIQANGRCVGYVVVTLTFSMEYGGRSAFVDDLFIQAPFRGQGLGTRVLTEVRGFCLGLGVRAMHLEVARANAPAQTVYRKVGFGATDRELLTLRLADPTHVIEGQGKPPPSNP